MTYSTFYAIDERLVQLDRELAEVDRRLGELEALVETQVSDLRDRLAALEAGLECRQCSTFPCTCSYEDPT